MNTECTIQDLFRTAQTDPRKFDGVRVIDELLQMARETGDIHCNLASDRALRFQIGEDSAVEVEVELAKAILRMMCARLSVLSTESGHDVSIYGGKGVIRIPRTSASDGRADESKSLRLLFHNTTDQQDFTLTAQ